MRAKILIIGLLFNSIALANCPSHQSVIYNCSFFEGNYQCSWNPDGGWYQGSTNHGSFPIMPGSQAKRFLRAFWTPDAHITNDTLSFGVTICQYEYRGQIIVLYQKDRDTN